MNSKVKPSEPVILPISNKKDDSRPLPIAEQNLNAFKFNEKFSSNSEITPNSTLKKRKLVEQSPESELRCLFSGYYFLLTGFKGRKTGSTPSKIDAVANKDQKNVATRKVNCKQSPMVLTSCKKQTETPNPRSGRNNASSVTPAKNTEVVSTPVLSNRKTSKRFTRSVSDKIDELDEKNEKGEPIVISESDMISILESLGGIVLERLSDITENMVVVVIAEKPSTTLKFLYSLARGLPAVRKGWIKKYYLILLHIYLDVLTLVRLSLLHHSNLIVEHVFKEINYTHSKIEL